MFRKILSSLVVLSLVIGGVTGLQAMGGNPAKSQEQTVGEESHVEVKKESKLSKAEVKQTQDKSKDEIKTHLPTKQLVSKAPTLFWQKQFEQNIGSIDMSGDGNYIVVSTNPESGTSSYVYLLDNAGNILWRYMATRSITGQASISKDGNYIGALIYSSEKWLIPNFAYFNKEGNLLWTKEEVPNAFTISENGGYILLSDNMESLYAILLDNNGNQIWQKSVNYSIPVMSEDSKHILLDNCLFNVMGNLIWEGDSFFRGLSISKDGSVMAGYNISRNKRNNDYIQTFNKSGELLFEYEVNKGVYSALLSPNGNYLIGLDSEGNVYFFNKSGMVLWRKFYNNVAPLSLITDDGKYCAVAYEYFYVDVLDQKGNVVGQINLEGAKDLIMDWSSNGKYLAITDREKKLYFYDNSSIIE